MISDEVFNNFIGITISTTIAQLGFIPDEAGEQVSKLIASDDSPAIIALGCYLDECRFAGNYDPLLKGLEVLAKGRISAIDSLTDKELPRAGQKYEYKGEKYHLLNGKVHSKHPDTGEWYISVEYCNADMIFNREARDFLNKFILVVT